jgi:hypothetical protein
MLKISWLEVFLPWKSGPYHDANPVWIFRLGIYLVRAQEDMRTNRQIIKQKIREVGDFFTTDCNLAIQSLY